MTCFELREAGGSLLILATEPQLLCGEPFGGENEAGRRDLDEHGELAAGIGPCRAALVVGDGLLGDAARAGKLRLASFGRHIEPGGQVGGARRPRMGGELVGPSLYRHERGPLIKFRNEKIKEIVESTPPSFVPGRDSVPEYPCRSSCETFFRGETRRA